MQNTFEQVVESIESLENIFKNNSFPAIEKDIILERLRKIYVSVQNGSISEGSVPQIPTDKYEVYQGIQDDVDLFFDTDHESYGKQMDLQEQEDELQREIEEEERLKAEEKRKAEEEVRLQAEQMRRQAEETQRRKDEEARLKAAKEQRLAEERRRQAEEEQRKREEEARLRALK